MSLKILVCYFLADQKIIPNRIKRYLTEECYEFYKEFWILKCGLHGYDYQEVSSEEMFWFYLLKFRSQNLRMKNSYYPRNLSEKYTSSEYLSDLSLLKETNCFDLLNEIYICKFTVNWNRILVRAI